MIVDYNCIVAAVLFLVSDLIAIVSVLQSQNREHFDYGKLKDLDPQYIQTEWEWQIQHRRVELSYEIINAFAWFVFAVPIIKVAWIQSNAGSRQIGLHVSIVVLALGGSFSELLGRLLALGSSNVLGWMAGSFNLDSWNVTDTTNTADVVNDFIGWRTLQMIDLVVGGLLLWIDAIEYLFLSGILILLAISIQSSQGSQLFGKRWAYFGIIMAALGIIDFATSILRFDNWEIFSGIGFVINVVNQVFLFPIWLIWLGKQLPKAEAMTLTRDTKDDNHSVTQSSEGELT